VTLCRDCRWCRPAWGSLILPLFWPFPIFWRYFWTGAKCRHPTSLERSSIDYVTGHIEKPRRMYCSAARSNAYGERCGPEARYFAPRTYPAWLWPAGAMTSGIAIVAAYVVFLRMLT
jgi:hypothetical protein